MVKAKKSRQSLQQTVKTKEDRKKRRLQIGFSLFIIIALTGSIFATFGMQGSTDPNTVTDTYNGQKFTFTNNVWQTELPGMAVETQFLYHPDDVAAITYTEAFETFEGYDLLYLSIDGNASDIQSLGGVAYKLSRILSSGRGIQNGVTLTEENDYEMPIMNCELIAQTDQDAAVILFNESDALSYQVNDNCYVINARTLNEFHLLTDRLIYELFDIIE